MGIFIAPMIARREPKHQGTLALVMFVALVAIVVASLIGEAAAIQGYISLKGPWFWIGNQGWEYLDLGRLWQILLIVGMVIWLVIVVRGIWPALRGEHPGNMPYLFLYSALSIPLFYAVGLAIGKNTHFRRGGLLAVLGGAPVGGGLPGAVHDDHGRLHLRAARRGAGGRRRRP